MKEPIDAPRRYSDSGAPEGKLLELLGAPPLSDARIARGEQRVTELARLPPAGGPTMTLWKALALMAVVVVPAVLVTRSRLSVPSGTNVRDVPATLAVNLPEPQDPPGATVESPAAPSVDVAQLPSAPVQAAPSTNTMTAEDRLARELGLVDGARAKLASNPAAALRELERHVAEFPNGQLSAEREILAVDALLRLGQVERARARGKSLSERAPHSSAARRIESLLREAPTRNSR